MSVIALNIQNESIKNEIINYLEKYKTQDIEITSIEDVKDLLLLKETRNDDKMSFDSYLENES